MNPWPWRLSRKERLEQLVNSYLKHLHISAQPVENARDLPLLSACVTWTSMNTHDLHQDVDRIAPARHQQSICPLPRHQHLQVRTFTVKLDRSCWGHHFEETWPMTKVCKLDIQEKRSVKPAQVEFFPPATVCKTWSSEQSCCNTIAITCCL